MLDTTSEHVDFMTLKDFEVYFRSIDNLDPIIKVLYDSKGKLDCFLTQHSKSKAFTLYSKKTHNWAGKRFTPDELDEINELLGSPIEKIDLEELEKF